MKIKVIGFDADDTLWVNEPYYLETEQKFCELLGNKFDDKRISEELFKTEMQNLDLYGFGAKSFILSMIETTIRLSEKNEAAELVEKVTSLGKELINKPLVLLENVEEVLKSLKSQNFRLIVATKGDLLDQERKLKLSGLEKYFHHIEIMSNKKEEDYRKLLSHLDIKPEEFLMIGNSMKSDIMPVLAIGGEAIYIPYHTVWLHEKVNEEDVQNNQFHKAESIIEVIDLINNHKE